MNVKKRKLFSFYFMSRISAKQQDEQGRPAEARKNSLPSSYEGKALINWLVGKLVALH